MQVNKVRNFLIILNNLQALKTASKTAGATSDLTRNEIAEKSLKKFTTVESEIENIGFDREISKERDRSPEKG